MLARFADKTQVFLGQCWNFLRPRRKLGLVSLVVLSSLVLVVWVIGTDVAQADSVADAIVAWIVKLMLLVAGLFIKLTFFILQFVIEVAGYNGFIDSSAVIVGWVMVRDVTNMFFVVVLLLISFGTILGLEQYEYKKLLVKLLMAAVIVNFSRIIAGIIIDVAQVIMITFVNGIAATAAGNLVNMFGVDKIFQLTENYDASTGGLFLAGVAAITFSAIMMMTMLTFLFLLLARMVTLWILIVLSPIAFVLSVLPQTQKYAGQWWQEFSGNVVAGPIIAFFLWLSFVTVGAGNVNQEVAAGSQHKLNEPGEESQESTGITKIMTWANMANFAIAIGMLLTGAKIAQQLGAAGGGMMAKAGEFGKRVAMVASGVTAARWAGRRAPGAGRKVGRAALMKAPLVGGEAWARRGRGIRAAVSRAYTERWVKPRVLAAGKRIETAYGEGKRWFGQRTLAKMGLWFAPAAFQEEYTKDKEAAAKYAQEHLEHLVSTSKTPVGKFKTWAEAELIRLRATGQEIKARKIQTVLKDLGATDEKILNDVASGKSWEDIEKSGKYTETEIFGAKRFNNAIESSAKAKQIEGMLAAQKQVRELEAIRQLLQTEAGKEIGAQSMAAKAQLEQLTFDMNQAKELLLASARDEVLVKQGRYSEANNRQIALANQAEQRIKSHSAGLDYVQTLAKTEAQQQRINERRAQLQREGKTEEEIRGDVLLNRMNRSLSEMQVANLAVHAAMADGNKAKILEAAKMNQDQSMDLTAEAIRKLQAQDLAELINDRVEATKEGLERAMDRLKQVYGDVMAGAMLERKRLYNEKAAGQGSLNRAGLYKIVGDQTVLVDADSEKDREFVSSRRTAGMSGAKITNIIGFSSSMDKNQAGGSVASSEAAKDIFTKLISGITANQLTNIDEYVKADLAAVLNNTALADLKDVAGRLKKEVKDARGLAGLLKFALEKGRMSNAENIKEVEEIVSELTRKAQEEKGKKGKK